MSNFQKDNDMLCTFYFASHIQTIILTTIIILNSNGTINCQQHTCYLKADNLEIDTSLESRYKDEEAFKDTDGEK